MQNQGRNPFEFAGAATLTPEMIGEVYVPDHNYQRFIDSTRNVFLFGERGSGKSMNLLYHSYRVQSIKRKPGEPVTFIGVFANCNTPLFHRKEHDLLDEVGQLRAAIVSEHLFVVWIAQALCLDLTRIESEISAEDLDSLRNDLTFLFDIDLPPDRPLFKSLSRYLVKRSIDSEYALNNIDVPFDKSVFYSFSSLVLPLLSAVQNVRPLQSAHFALMIDDAQYLNRHQIRALNSWIAYRDRTLFSLKVAAPRRDYTDFKTAAGGSILEGHDFTSIDCEQPFQNDRSPFYKLAADIFQKRLLRAGIPMTPEEYFPTNATFMKGILSAEESVRSEFLKKIPNADKKACDDHVYKMGRVQYFRERDARANLPPYSGFDTIVHLSTGVIRNLLEPCYHMYDDVMSKHQGSSKLIDPSIQTSVIRARSEALWRTLEEGLDNTVDNCTREQAQQIHQIFDNLAILFRERLKRHSSEPRVLTFSISAFRDNEGMLKNVRDLLEIARKAQMLYLRSGNAKDRGRRETYFTPNRLLWPIRGLDPFGQHGRVSLKLADIWAAANGKPFPYVDEEVEEDANEQLELGI